MVPNDDPSPIVKVTKQNGSTVSAGDLVAGKEYDVKYEADGNHGRFVIQAERELQQPRLNRKQRRRASALRRRKR